LARRDRARRADAIDRWGWIAVALVWLALGLVLRWNIGITLVVAAVVAGLVAWNGMLRIKRRALLQDLRDEQREEKA
jgi:uncharacterized membrane protein